MRSILILYVQHGDEARIIAHTNPNDQLSVAALVEKLIDLQKLIHAQDLEQLNKKYKLDSCCDMIPLITYDRSA